MKTGQLVLVKDSMAPIKVCACHHVLVVQHIFRLHLFLRQHIPYNSAHFIRLFVYGIGLHYDISWVPAAHAVLLAYIETGRCGNHHQHHGRQDTDRGKPRAVALHAVHHGGHREKMICLVVVLFVLLQYLTNHHRTCNKKQICGYDYHNHRYKKPHQRRQWVLNFHRDVIGPCQKNNSYKCQKPIGLGRLFPHIFAVKQLHRLGNMNLTQTVEINQHINHCKQQHALPNRLHFHCKHKIHAVFQYVRHAKLCQL